MFPIWLYNILLDHDVSLHNLVVLIVTIPTSPSLSKTESICKRYGVMLFCWNYPGEGPESPAHPGISGPRTRSLRPLVFSLPNVVAAVRYWTGVRRYPGDGPESPAQGTRNLRPQFFSAHLRLCGAVLDRGPEHTRRRSGVSGLAGVSAPLDQNIWPSPMTRSTRSLAGMSGPGRSLRPTYTGVSGLKRL